MLLHKYKYSLNRGLTLRRDASSKPSTLTTFAVVSRGTPALYSISVGPQHDILTLHNEQEYLHRRCAYVAESNAELLTRTPHCPAVPRCLSVLIASHQAHADHLLTGQTDSPTEHPDSLLLQAFRAIHSTKQEKSWISLCVVGVCSESMLTDELQGGQEGVRQALRLRANDRSLTKYELEGVTRTKLESEEALREKLTEYERQKSHRETLSVFKEEKYWDWLQGELFVLEELQGEEEAVVRSHYLLKVNQYLEGGTSLMLSLGMVLRQVAGRQARGSGDSKLLKLISNCLSGECSVRLFLQVGHHLSLREQYLALVPTAEASPLAADHHQLAFCYIKGYQNYPAITALLRAQAPTQGGLKEAQGVRAYARETASSLEKRRVNSIQAQVDSESEQSGLETAIQEAASLYRHSHQERFRLSHLKKSNDAALRKHRQIVDHFSTLDKPPSEFYRSERMRQKPENRVSLNARTPKETMKSEQKERKDVREAGYKLSGWDSAFEIYAKGRKMKNYRKYSSRREKREVDLLEQRVKQEILQLDQEDLYLYGEPQFDVLS